MSLAADGRHLVYSSLDAKGGIRKVAFDPVSGSVKGLPSVVTGGTSRFGSRRNPHRTVSGWLSTAAREGTTFSCPRPDGSDLKQLTTDGARNRNPVWSPDGARLAFVSNRGATYNVWTINQDGSGLRQLTYSPLGFVNAIWSPDGKKMSLVDAEGGDKIAIFDPSQPWAGQTLQMLPRFLGNPPLFFPVAWSPDGQYLAGAPSPSGVVIFSCATGEYVRLNEAGTPTSWLSDGRRIVYDDDGKLFLIDRQTKKSREILAVPGEILTDAALTRDSRTLYFSQYVSEADVWMGEIK